MSARTERNIPVRRQKSEQSVVNFDVERLKAPFLLRCGAIAIDYILLICMPVIGLLLGRAFNYDGAKLLTSEISNVGWLALVLLALTNFVQPVALNSGDKLKLGDTTLHFVVA